MFWRKKTQVVNHVLQSILATCPDGIICIDTASLVIEWSRKCEDLFGWRRNEIIGKCLTDFIIPERHKAGHRRGMDRFLRTRSSRLIGLNSIELKGVHKDGHEVPIRLSLSLCSTREDKSERGILFIGFVEDTSAELINQDRIAEVKKTTAMMHSFLSNVPEAVLVLGMDDRGVFQNSEFDLYQEDRSITEVIDELDIRRLLKRSTVNGESVVASVSRHVPRTGKYYDVTLVHVPMEEIYYNMIFLRDDTRKVRAAHHLQEMTLRTLSGSGKFSHQVKFIDDMSRCMRHSLDGILRDTKDDHSVTSQSARRLSGIVDMVERIAYLETHPPHEEIGLNDLLIDIHDTYTRCFNAKTTTFILVLPLDVPDDATVPVGARVVLQHILDHCLRVAGLNRTVELNMTETRSTYTFHVTDNAAGEAVHIDHPFTWSGTNDLYVANRASQLIDGNLEVETAGNGVSFTLTIPTSLITRHNARNWNFKVLKP